MNITTVTVSGADNGVHPEELLRIAEQFPFVEFGILLSRSREGTGRYPDREWLDRLISIGKDLKLSGHLCGEYVREALKGNDIFPYKEVFNRCDRIQLNFMGLKGLEAQPRQGFFDLLRKWNKNVIFQMTGRNGYLLHTSKIRGIDVSLLFDGSGGNGRIPETWPVPINGTFCGYAGGLSPDNLRWHLGKISEVADDASIWIDAESGLRTNNTLTLNKVKDFLQMAQEGIHETDYRSL